jgi:transcriptional regulator with XRE-family HTH domain
MNLEKAFPILLKKYRKNKKLSQEELSNRCGLDRTYISLLERGKRKPTLTVVFALCEQLDIEASEFVKEMEQYINISE